MNLRVLGRLHGSVSERARCPAIHRRDALAAGGGLLALFALHSLGCGSTETTPTPERGFPAGASSDYAVGDVRFFDSGTFFVVRDAAGLYAMTAVCTHQGCTVGSGASSLACPCHGSAYDLDGNVTHGPATAPLEHYALRIDDTGAVFVDTDTVVAPETRVAG